MAANSSLFLLSKEEEMGSNETPFSQEPKKRLRKEAQATEDVAYKPLIDEKESPVVCDEELIKEEKVSFIVLNGERDVAREVEDKELMLRKWLASSSSAPLVDDEIDDEVCCMSNVKITGTCFCKIFVVLYLLACLLVSALYIAIYGPNELYLMPETPPPYKPSKVRGEFRHIHHVSVHSVNFVNITCNFSNAAGIYFMFTLL